MEEESGKKPFDELDIDDQMVYYNRARVLISRGYIEDKSEDDLALEIYEAKWRITTLLHLKP